MCGWPVLHPFPVMTSREIEHRSERHDLSGVDFGMRDVVVPFDMIDIDLFGDPRLLI